MHHRAKRLLEQYYTYMVTIAHIKKKKYVTKEQLDLAIHKLKLQYPFLETSDYHYELGDCYKQLHVHFIAKGKKRICFRNSCRIDDFYVKWKRVWSKGVYAYITKKTPNHIAQEQVFTENWYNNNYGFV